MERNIPWNSKTHPSLYPHTNNKKQQRALTTFDEPILKMYFQPFHEMRSSTTSIKESIRAIAAGICVVQEQNQ
jgi:hypothetical protein